MQDKELAKFSRGNYTCTAINMAGVESVASQLQLCIGLEELCDTCQGIVIISHNCLKFRKSLIINKIVF